MLSSAYQISERVGAVWYFHGLGLETVSSGESPSRVSGRWVHSYWLSASDRPHSQLLASVSCVFGVVCIKLIFLFRFVGLGA